MEKIGNYFLVIAVAIVVFTLGFGMGSISSANNFFPGIQNREPSGCIAFANYNKDPIVETYENMKLYFMGNGIGFRNSDGSVLLWDRPRIDPALAAYLQEDDVVSVTIAYTITGVNCNEDNTVNFFYRMGEILSVEEQ